MHGSQGHNLLCGIDCLVKVGHDAPGRDRHVRQKRAADIVFVRFKEGWHVDARHKCQLAQKLGPCGTAVPGLFKMVQQINHGFLAVAKDDAVQEGRHGFCRDGSTAACHNKGALP